MKFLMLIEHAEGQLDESIPPTLMEAVGTWVGDAKRRGVLLDTAGLKGTKEGFRVRSAGGKLHVTDGPFTEAKEIVGGFLMIEVFSRMEAQEIAREFMELHRVHWPAFEAACEVRPLEGCG